MKNFFVSCFVLSLMLLNSMAQPVILKQPASQTVVEGAIATFTVSVSGSGPFRYQWMLNGTNLPDMITTVAGKGTNSYSGDGGAATNASLNFPASVAVDAAGNLFISDSYNNRIRKVDTNGIITTVAGNGILGYSGDGGAATNAACNEPMSVALDAAGNLLIADCGNGRIRKVDTNGIITTVVGTGDPSQLNNYSGEGGAATNAQLYIPTGITLDSAGNLFFTDGATCVRKVDTNGIITTVAGNGTNGYYGDGGVATQAAFRNLVSVGVDGVGNLFIADMDIGNVRKVDTNGIITTLAGNRTYDYSGVYGKTTYASLFFPTGLAVTPAGDILIVDHRNYLIRKLDTNGIMTTVAGNGRLANPEEGGPDGGAATNACLCLTCGITLDATGIIYLTEINRVLKIGQFSTLKLPDVTVESSGNYQVVVTGGGGSVTSSVASLLVFSSSNITNPPNIVSTHANPIKLTNNLVIGSMLANSATNSPPETLAIIAPPLVKLRFIGGQPLLWPCIDLVDKRWVIV